MLVQFSKHVWGDEIATRVAPAAVNALLPEPAHEYIVGLRSVYARDGEPEVGVFGFVKTADLARLLFPEVA